MQSPNFCFRSLHQYLRIIFLRSNVLLLLFVSMSVAHAGMTIPYIAVPTTPSDPGYFYQVTVESYASRLQYLGEYDLGNDGTFDIALEIMLTIAVPKSDKGRNMLYLLACDEAAAEAFLSLPGSGSDMKSIQVPSYCAMANHTLDYYCQSYPLEDESPDQFVYQSSKVISGSVDEMPLSAYSILGDNSKSANTNSKSSNTTSNTVMFFIDSCETLGGQQGILRSCLKYPPDFNPPDPSKQGSDDDTFCFYCPNNYPSSYTSQISDIAENEGCIISPSLPPTIHGTVSMNLCSSKGDCLGKTTSIQSIFYALAALAWGITTFIWVVHIRAAARDAVIELQTKMKFIPVTHLVYVVLTFVDHYTEDKTVGTARNLIQNIVIFAQLVALAVFAEMVIVIAKGWKITRPALHPREVQWIRFVTVCWGGSSALLKHSNDRQLAVVIVWGLSWASVVFMVWYNSAFNLNMLKYQLAMVRQLDLNPQLTPVYTKFILFRRFRGLLAGYILLSCVLGVVGLVNDATHHSSEWISLVANEGLTLLLFVALGYTFRCRRFGRLMQPQQNGVLQADASAERAAEQNAIHRASILPEPTPLVSVESPKHKKTIVVLNPDQAPWLATALEATEPVVTPATPPKLTASP
ncbi:Transmembrane protein [Phytophthora megakarya]|uniref:Transmembrane protein n=1 Tax=Phytophthora megakarya TaxID=4795 RepID=A0A225WLT7_9STRA|nr:Transmembrane protein [Phytophthora megakarya]